MNVTIDCDVVDTPRDVNVLDFLSSRARELTHLVQELRTRRSGSQRVVQAALPRHLRRRAASHDPRRVPRRLRAAVEDEMRRMRVKQPARKKKRQSAVHKNESTLSSRCVSAKPCRLETHLWHRRRFHMIAEYDRVVPLRPTHRGLRAGYRLASREMLLFDLSFLTWLEIQGPAQVLQMKMASIGVQGPCSSWKRVLLHCPDGSALAPADYLWHPNGGQLWLWLHPAAEADVCPVLTELFHLPEASVVFRPLALNRFHLVGPHAARVCANALGVQPVDGMMALQMADLRLQATMQAESDLWHDDIRSSGSSVPLLLVSSSAPPAASWELLVPRGHATAMWNTLVKGGARAGGVEDLSALAEESGVALFPLEYPDCPAFPRFVADHARTQQREWLRRPPAKRANFERLGIAAPFDLPWQRLALEWGQQGTLAVLRGADACDRLEVAGAESASWLVPVQLVGRVTGHAIICLPCQTDDIQQAPTEPPALLESTEDAALVHSCERAVMGFVTVGRFLWSRGRNGGRGFVCGRALLEATRLGCRGADANWRLLVRNRDSLHYQWAVVSLWNPAP